MKMEEVFHFEKLRKFFEEIKNLRIDPKTDIATIKEKYILVLENKLVIPGIFSLEGIKELESKNVFKKGNVRAYKLGWTPFKGGPEDNYIEEGELTSKSKRDMEELFDRIMGREPL